MNVSFAAQQADQQAISFDSRLPVSHLSFTGGETRLNLNSSSNSRLALNINSSGRDSKRRAGNLSRSQGSPKNRSGVGARYARSQGSPKNRSGAKRSPPGSPTTSLAHRSSAQNSPSAVQRRFSNLMKTPRQDSLKWTKPKIEPDDTGDSTPRDVQDQITELLTPRSANKFGSKRSERAMGIAHSRSGMGKQKIAADLEDGTTTRQRTMEQVDKKIKESTITRHKAHMFTNWFTNEDDEQAYQRYCSVYIQDAKRFLLVFMAAHLLQILYETLTDFRGDSFVEMEGKATADYYDYTSFKNWVHLCYLSSTIPFCVAFSYPRRSWKPWMLRCWKFWIWVCLLLAVCGLLLRQTFVATTAVAAAKEILDTSNTSYEMKAVEVWGKRQQVLVLMLGSTILVAIAQLGFLNVRVGPIYMVSLAILSTLTLVLVIIAEGLPLHQQGLMGMIVALVASSSLTLFLDKSARNQYLNLRNAGEENVGLNLRIEDVLNKGYEADEKDAVDGMLEGQRQILDMQIPFKDLHLEKQIGAGAYGDVIKGLYHGTTIVFKRMRRENISAQNLELFADEVKLMVGLRHPNVVQFIGASWDSYSNIGFVLEFVEGGDLYSVLHDNKKTRLTWEGIRIEKKRKTKILHSSDPANKMAIESARGMAYLHSRQPPIVHRDLKSVNILVTETYSCKVADFGMSRVGGPMNTSPRKTVVGTPLWVAPEVVRQEPHTTAADVFSFGIVLGECYSRQDPYYEQLKTNTAQSIMIRVEADGLRPTIDDEAPNALKELIKDCVEDQPQRRPNMVEVLNRLYAMESTLNEDMRDMMSRTDKQLMWERLVDTLPFFQGVNQQFRDTFMKGVLLKEYLPITVVVNEGDEADAVFFVKSGVLDVLVGNRKVHTLRKDAFFGEQAFRTYTEGEHDTPRAPGSAPKFKSAGSKRTATVRCSTRCQLLMLHRNEFFTLVNSFPDFGTRLKTQREYIFDGAVKDAKTASGNSFVPPRSSPASPQLSRANSSPNHLLGRDVPASFGSRRGQRRKLSTLRYENKAPVEATTPMSVVGEMSINTGDGPLLSPMLGNMDQQNLAPRPVVPLLSLLAPSIEN